MPYYQPLYVATVTTTAPYMWHAMQPPIIPPYWYVTQPSITSTVWWTNNVVNSHMYAPPMREETPQPRMRRLEPRPREPLLLEAASKARALLLSQLTEEQRIDFQERRKFVVVGKHSGAHYEIDTSHIVGNVTRLHDSARFCGHCRGDIPMDDHILAQKLMLENDEEAFLAIANRHR